MSRKIDEGSYPLTCYVSSLFCLRCATTSGASGTLRCSPTAGFSALALH